MFDNQDREELNITAYTVDSSAFDSTKAGICDISITPIDTVIAPITYQVTVRENVEYEWKFIRFGQSTSSKNSCEVMPDGTIRLVALEGAGKVTGDHDGISFYYTEIDGTKDNFVLSADIKVLAYAKDPHDGQESFGIMARDAIGTPGDSSIFASNIAAVGGFSGGTRNPNGTQLFIRTGVTSPDGAGSNGVCRVMLQEVKPAENNTHPKANYRLTLAKTNSGYTGKINNGTEEIFYEPDILTVQDSKIYLGFYTARLATIEVSNVQFTVTAADSDAPKVEPPAQPIEPTFAVESLDKVSNPAYNLMIRANVNGTVTVKKGNDIIVADGVISANKQLIIPTVLAASGATNFSMTFLPDDTQYLTSYNKIIQNFTVNVATLANGGDIYVSPDGTSSGNGTVENPVDLDTAINYVAAGQKILLLDGTYTRSTLINIPKYNDGTADAMKYLIAAPGASPVFDFGKVTAGVMLSGNYWHIKGIDFTHSAGNEKPFTVGGSHNIVELCRFYNNGETGLQISRTDFANEISQWPSYNLILNCTSFNNRDPSDNNADGFAAKLTSGEGNVFRGCISHNNIDDGWDLYTKAGSGKIGAVVIENCIAYNNGTLTDGTVGKGDKNGFKLGGEGIHVPHVIKNSIAFGNGAVGFTSNSNPGVIAINNMSWQNATNLTFTTYTGITPDFRLSQFISYQGAGKDNYVAGLEASDNYLFDGSASINKTGEQFTDAAFNSLKAPLPPYARKSNGDIQWSSFWVRFLNVFDDSDSSDDESSVPTPTAKPTSAPTPAPTQAPTPTSALSVTEDGSVITASAVVKPEIDLTTGTAAATIGVNEANDLVDKAIAAEALGQKAVVEIKAEVAADINAVAVEIPRASFNKLAEETNADVKVDAGIGSITFNTKAVESISVTADVGNISIRIDKVDNSSLSPQVQEKVGDRPVFDFSVKAGNREISSFDGGSAEISIPYTPKPGENEESIIVYYIDNTGNLITVRGRYDAATGSVKFVTTHFSWYAVGYNEVRFSDVAASAWYHKAVGFMSARSIVRGVGGGRFEPENNVTRADFLIMVMNAYGIDLDETITDNFTDAGDKYYTKYLGTGKRLGLVSGIGNNEYAPEATINRQDMFVILYRALEKLGELPADTTGKSIESFGDAGDIADYAKEVMKLFVETGTIAGDGKNLIPKSTSTRAQAAQVLYNLLSQ